MINCTSYRTCDKCEGAMENCNVLKTEGDSLKLADKLTMPSP
jgi:hypothetical protein